MIDEKHPTYPLVGRALEALRVLRTGSGLAGQGARYAIAGGVVTAFYVSLTTVLALVVGLPFQLALALGFCLALTLHFTLQRVFVWADREQFALSFHYQAGRYLIASAVQYGMTAVSTSFLPPLLGMSAEAVYIIVVPLLALSNFLVFRYMVFHGASPVGAPASGPSVKTA